MTNSESDTGSGVMTRLFTEVFGELSERQSIDSSVSTAWEELPSYPEVHAD